MSSLLGYVGAVAIPVAWVLFRYDVYESRHWATVNPATVWLAGAGNAVMAYYALVVQNPPFFLLHATLACFTVTEFLLLVYMRKAQTGAAPREEES